MNENKVKVSENRIKLFHLSVIYLLHGENFKTVQDTQPEMHVGCRSKGPKRRHAVTQSRSQETHVLSWRLQEEKQTNFAFRSSVQRNCSHEQKPTVFQQAVHALRR